MKVRNLCVGGGGNIGSQIAFQAAFKGYKVKVWSRRQESLDKAKKRIDKLKDDYHKMIDDMKKGKLYIPKGIYDGEPEKLTDEITKKLKEDVDKGYDSIEHSLDLGEASKDADFLIESIIENEKIKREFFQNLSKVCPEKTIITTNSSTLLPSTFAEDTGRPEKFFGFHYSSQQWYANLIEIMPHEKTNPIYLDVAEEFAKGLGMVPIRMKKEISGYILNNMFRPLIRSSWELWGDDAADYKLIDKDWKINTREYDAPFTMIDGVGLMVSKYIYSSMPESKDPNSIIYKILTKIDERIEKGLLGQETGEGFYKYK